MVTQNDYDQSLKKSLQIGGSGSKVAHFGATNNTTLMYNGEEQICEMKANDEKSIDKKQRKEALDKIVNRVKGNVVGVKGNKDDIVFQNEKKNE